jgi:hypothetical protein
MLIAEVYAVFIKADGEFSIEGHRPYDETRFGEGATIRHAFLMTADGLSAVSFQVSASASANLAVRWALWDGTPDDVEPSSHRRAFDGESIIHVTAGTRRWHTVAFPRHGSSRDRWYTLYLTLADAGSPRPAAIAVSATMDNPDRGGVLWVGETRMPGSLRLRAAYEGRTIYREFSRAAEPNLPPVLRSPAVQIAVAMALHWALITFAYLLRSESLAAMTAARLPGKSE